MRIAIIVAIAATISPGRVVAQDSLPAGRIVAQGLLGGAGAFAGLLGGCYVGAQGGDTWLDSDSPGLGGCVILGLVGVPLGSSLGVYLGGRATGGHGSYGSTAAGAVLGTLAFMGIASAGLDPDQPPFWIVLAGLPTAGAILMYSSSQRNRTAQLRIGPGWARGPVVAMRLTF